MARPIAPTPVLKGPDADRFIEAAKSLKKAPKIEFDTGQIKAVLRKLAAETKK